MKRGHISHVLQKMMLAMVIIMTAVCGTDSSSARSPLPSAELQQLNKAMANAPKYRAAKVKSIDSLVNLARKATTPHERFSRYMAIGDFYHNFVADSALHYFILADKEAHLSADLSLVHQADIAMVGAMSVAGFFNEASLRLDSMEHLQLPMQQKLELWKAERQLFSSMIAYAGDETPLSKEYRNRYLAIDDSLLAHLPKNSQDYKFIFAERLVSSGQYGEARQRLQAILNTNPVSANIYGKAAYQLAMVCRHQGEEEQYARFLAKAAVSDIQGCATEGWALPKLAEWLYQNGELDQAFTYINFSLSEAKAGNARMRSSVISSMMPAIDEAYRKNLTSSNDRLAAYLFVAVILFLITTSLIIMLLRQVKKARITQRKLAENSRLREMYLGNFVGLCSTYSSKLQSWQKMVTRKISSGQTDDLLKTLKQGKISGENDDFHDAIDKAFLELYPDFVEEVNALLRDDEQIHLNKKGTLSPELRIYALIRLGVEESSRIATILQYSTNTVYTYRNKMRNKAINRATFEQQVRDLDYEP